MSAVRFVLASASPARLATLRSAGVEPEVIVSNVDEAGIAADSVAELVERLARAKATAVARHLRGRPDEPALVLGCDSLLDMDGVGLGKPGTPGEARDRWRTMRGRHGVLRTGHALITADGRQVSEVASTAVHFADITDAEVEAYVAGGEPLTVAGAFTIDGIGGWFVEAVNGDHHNVVGLSLPLLRRMLHGLGFTLHDIGVAGFGSSAALRAGLRAGRDGG